MSSRSFFLTRELCEQVFGNLRVSFEVVLKQEGSEAFALAILNPTLTYEQAEGLLMGNGGWDNIILWEDHVGDSDDLTKYIDNARLKALEALYHRETLSRVLINRPACLRAGRIGWIGGVYFEGMSFGGSGLNELRDEEEVYRFARLLARGVKVAARWPSQQARVAQLRAWGGFLGGRS